ncbi:MAG TPA: ABC transporter permease [Bryobacteraceae bacterium]|jgi:putative ABC transport system permease protein|nr:ABC transporter permease [Bryobacteraceae bacterium]
MQETSSSATRFQFISAVGLAWDSLRAHKLRTFLTLLGIMIGVASVILVGSGIDGLGLYADESVSKAFGSESFVLEQVGQIKSRRELFDKLKYNRELKLADERYLEQINSDNTLYSPYRNATTDTKREDMTSEDTTIIGAASDLADIRDMVLTEGRFYTRTEEQGASLVAVIGDDLKNNLFPNVGSPLGRTFKIQGIDFTVVGVQERLGSAFGNSQDNDAYIPITTFNRLFGPGSSIAIFARPKPSSGLSLQQSLDYTRVALRAKFHQKPGENDRFDLVTPDAIRGFIDQLLAIVALVVVPITCISLVVGGIVIMNIMLVSVTERTREIGIRKSLGARRSDIMLQILIESVMMAFAGGAVGVGIGAVLTRILTAAFGVTLRVTPMYVALSVFVSAAVGIVSGYYPASKAAKLDPIVALRAE